jgi:excisionase family DNA binding protein
MSTHSPTDDKAARARVLLTEAIDFLVEIAEGPPERRVDDLYSLREVARRLHISHPTLYDRINSGELHTLTIGRRRFVSETQLSDYIRRREQAGDR